MIKRILLSVICLLHFTHLAFPQESPRLEKRGKATQLIVDGKPFLILGGELHNSSSSDLQYLDPLWEPLQKMNLNTALVAVSWQLVEPQEGKFDFSLVDGIVKGARDHNMKLILLWFGSWKNGLSHYAPDWVKQDYKRFPRVVLDNGKSTETISALSQEAAKADAKAFAAFMQHIKKIDASQQTVIMIQVENEVGVIGGTRDHSSFANAEFAKPVPPELLTGLRKNKKELQPSFKKLWEASGSKTSGTWTEVFGNTAAADEAFMAWHYARYINSVAAAGKAAYNLPMFVNAWIVQPTDKKPGDYPGGGPQAHVHDIWRVGAPELDFLAPDIYLPDFKDIVAVYHHPWNPLFIPESFAGINGAANAVYAIGKHSGLGYSPFGIDNKTDDPSQTPIAKVYDLLKQLTPDITKAQEKGSVTAVSIDTLDKPEPLILGDYSIHTRLRSNWNGVRQADKGYAIIIQIDKNEFIVAGADVDVVFVPASSGPRMAGIASVYEGKYEGNSWKPGRLLNGDDIMMSYKLDEEAAANKTGTGARLKSEPTILKVKLYRYE